MSSPQGGSTLLSLILGQHSRAANLGEVSFIPKLLAMKELCTCGELLAECPSWDGVFKELSSRTGVDMRSSPYGLYIGDAIKGKTGSGLVDHTYQTRSRMLSAKVRGAIDTASLFYGPSSVKLKRIALPSVTTSVKNTLQLYESAAQVWEKDIIIDASKLPRKAAHLYQYDPDRVRIIHLVRDGRGVTNSRMKKNMDFNEAAGRWNYYHRITKRILNRWVAPEHRTRIRYEDFVKDPDIHIQSLCDWLEIPYSKEMIEFNEDQVIHSAGGNPARFRIKSGLKPSDERWRTELSQEILAKFENIGGELNREFGYE